MSVCVFSEPSLAGRSRRVGVLLLLTLGSLGLAHESAAASLKGVQRGTTTIAGGSAVATATLSPAVDTTKAFLVFGVSENTSSPTDGQVSGQITNSTTVTFRRDGSAGAVTMNWYVAEFTSGVTVQRGTADMDVAPRPHNVTLPIAVDLARSFPIVSYLTTGGNFAFDDFVKAKLTSTTNLALDAPNVPAPTAPLFAEWQVVEYLDADVQTGDVTFLAGEASKTVTPLVAAVNTAKSWLVYSYKCDPAAPGPGCPSSPDPNIGNKLVRGVVTNGNTLTFDRSNTGVQLALTWYLVEFTDATTVQGASEPFLMAETLKNVPLSPVSPGSSIAVAGGDYMRGGRSPYAGNDIPGVAWFNLDITASNNLRISRGAGGLATADVGWFVVSFACDCPALGMTEAAGMVTVTAQSSFRMRFNEAAGGAIDQFFDLAEDPTPLNDLAGGTGSGRGLHANGLEIGGTTFYNVDQNNQGAKLDVLEATPTRVRVRQEAFYQQDPGGTAILAGLKGVGDYSIYPAGRLALRWNHRATSAVTYTVNDLDLNIHQAAAPLNTWAAYGETGALPNPGTDDFLLVQSEVAGARTDFLHIMYKDWCTSPPGAPCTEANGYLAQADATDSFFNAGNQWRNSFWEDNTGATILAGTSETWNFLTYFKPTSFLNNADAAVTTRRTDYRAPDSLFVMVGSPWIDASENTLVLDDFNESEAAYVLTFDPSLGLNFDIDGATTRYSSFFKIRQWRSLQDPPSVTLEGFALANDVNFRADVKPLARAHFAQDLTWYSTLQSNGAVTSPDVGSAGTVSNGGDFPQGRYGNGARFDTDGERLSFPPVGNLDPAEGTIEFWYRPSYGYGSGPAGDDSALFGYWIDPSNYFYAWHTPYPGSGPGTDEGLTFDIRSGGAIFSVDVGAVPGGPIYWRANEWVHLRFVWKSDPATPRLEIYLNGDRIGPAPAGSYPTPVALDTAFLIGDRERFNVPSDNAKGIIDEFRVYSSADAPISLARGGLSGAADEFLATGSNNFPLSFGAVDAQGRGEYAYFGADSKFRGLNVALAAPGQGSTPVVAWEYWNGSGWTPLVIDGDETNDLTNANGTIYWNGDPFNWSAYSVNGGPDLYYVRAHLSSGDFATQFPVEAIVKTDILLFQYCGDVMANAQTFVFAVPMPTAVDLASFSARGLDGAVELVWQTASELDNLGFQLYRAESSQGPYERITASAIPGLGSSPAGARYRYVDSRLVNGKLYFYQLEDIETSGRTERHGPVSATPRAGTGGEESSSSSKISYGDAGASSFQVVRRTGTELVLELRTEGFEAEVQPDGSLRFSIPGFDVSSEPGTPAIPVKRTWLEIQSGRGVSLGLVTVERVESFSSLRPSATDSFEVVASRRGPVRAGRRAQREGPAFRGAGTYPENWARLVSVGYQGAVKKALLEVSPLRWDRKTGELLLARTLRLRIAFTGRDESAHREVYHYRRGAGAVVRLVSREEGLYGVRFEDTGFGRAVAARSLRLSRHGEPVAFHLEPGNAAFGRGSMLYFWSEGASLNPYGHETVYELERAAAGVSMPIASSSPSGKSVGFHWKTVEREENRYYQAALLHAEDLWLWDLLFAPIEKSYTFEVSGLAASTEAPRLSLWLQGTSDFDASPDHHLRARVNGVAAADVSFDGKNPLHLEAEIAQGVLRDGENVLSIENVGDTAASYSMVMLDRFTVAYPKELRAEASKLEGEFSESGEAEIAGMSRGAHVLDVTDAAARWLIGAEPGSAGLRLEVEAGRRYLVVDAGAVLKPEVRIPAGSRLRGERNRADFLMVGPREHLQVAAPLLQLRRSQGLVGLAVPLEEIYSEFGYGESRPEALREFLTYAYHHWRKPAPRYVVLLGDATYDFKDYLGTGVKNQVPALMVKTSYLWTASDPAYAEVNGEDTLPDLAIGRLPAATAEELRVMVDKILAYEAGHWGRVGAAVVVADNRDGAGDFERDAEELASGLLASRNPQRIYLGRLGVEKTRQAIVDALDDGASVLSYVGHGGIHLWAHESLFTTANVTSLAPQPAQPLVLTWNCLNGYFHFPYFNALSEELLKAEGKGAIATFSPSGLSLNEPAHLFHKALVNELLSGKHARLGDAVLAAQAAYAETGAFAELLSIYHLLGDPALKLQ